ncbi:Arsenite methyltransferase [Sesamum angolense]|uniref:Arsenite methyltransferase n=1 Tax=Sesamum angolense TaxID=2727404 RepID=A0AAE1W3B8_9LAMI|nr:Arsenite methyltransferase [Sesamum angolense]
MALSTISKLSNVNTSAVTSTRSRYPNSSTRKRSAPARIRTASERSSGGGLVADFEEGEPERPKWTGETSLSRLVGSLISFKPLYSVLKLGARQVLISTAEKANIPWRDMTKEILESDVYSEKDAIEDPSIVYPDYYLNPFHAYDEETFLGCLHLKSSDKFKAKCNILIRNFDTAEAEAATMSIAKRAIPSASSVDEANQIVRGNWLQAIESHHQKHSGNSTIREILDIGCSVGVSTRFLADKFPSAKVTGLDLSPYFLAVAQYKDNKMNQGTEPIRWIHGNGENTGLPSKSFDLVSIAYVFHECPERAIKNMVKEAFRLLRPGGTFAITDNSPKSKILQVTLLLTFPCPLIFVHTSQLLGKENVKSVETERGFGRGQHGLVPQTAHWIDMRLDWSLREVIVHLVHMSLIFPEKGAPREPLGGFKALKALLQPSGDDSTSPRRGVGEGTSSFPKLDLMDCDLICLVRLNLNVRV